DVRVRHEQAIAADSCRGAGLGGEVRGDEFTDLGAVSHLEVRSLARVLEILRRAADRGRVMDAAGAAGLGPAPYQSVAAARGAVADPAGRADHRARAHGDARAEAGALVDEGGGMDLCAHVGFLSTTIASSSASATS